MKKLYGLPTLAAGLTALAAWAFYRTAHFDGMHALHWRVPLDLRIYEMSGADLAAGGDLYDAPYIDDLPFTYPPFAGFLFRGLAGLSDAALIAAWQGGTALALAAVVLLVLHNRGVRLGFGTWYVAVAYAACCFGLQPVHGTFFFGQINILLMFLVSLDLLPRRWRLPGIGVGLAAGLKLTPAFMGLVLLFQRRWAAAAGAVATFAATVAVGFAVIPDAKVFWTDAMFNSSRVGDHSNPGAQALRSLLIRVFGTDSTGVWLAAVGVVFAITCAAIWVAVRRDNAAAAMAFAGLSSCLVSPFAWYHHFVWVVPLGAVIMVGVNQRLGALWCRHGSGGTAGAGGFWRSQAAGLASLLITAAALLPWVSSPLWYDASYRGIGEATGLGEAAQLLYAGAAVVYMAAYACFGAWQEAGGRDGRHGRHARHARKAPLFASRASRLGELG